MRKLLIVMLMVLAIAMFGCKEAEEEETPAGTTVVGCADAADLADNSICMVVAGEKIEGTTTSDTNAPFGLDPYVQYQYQSDDDEYQLAFVKSFSSGTTDYGNLSDLSGWDTFYMMDLKGTVSTGEMTLTSSSVINSIVFSPSGTSNMFAGSNYPMGNGSSASITISNAAGSIGDKFQGTLGEIKLCKINSSFTFVDACATSITITSGSFNITRDADRTDNLAPVNPSISINGGSGTTDSRLVTLSNSAGDDNGVTGYYLSETNSTPSIYADGWINVPANTLYSDDVAFSLSSGNGQKTVYVWFRDAAGNISASATDGIELTQVDTSAPANPVVSINGGDSTTDSISATLSISADDDTGVTWYYASETASTPNAEGWTDVTADANYSDNVAITLNAGNGTKTIYVWFRDAAGNISGRTSDSIELVNWISDTALIGIWELTKLNGETTPFNVTLVMGSETYAMSSGDCENELGTYTAVNGQLSMKVVKMGTPTGSSSDCDGVGFVNTSTYTVNASSITVIDTSNGESFELEFTKQPMPSTNKTDLTGSWELSQYDNVDSSFNVTVAFTDTTYTMSNPSCTGELGSYVTYDTYWGETKITVITTTVGTGSDCDPVGYTSTDDFTFEQDSITTSGITDGEYHTLKFTKSASGIPQPQQSPASVRRTMPLILH